MERSYDVLVVGSGAGGLATAITAKKHGLSVLVIEKEPVFGGTTAFSGGVLWIPGNRHGRVNNPGDSRAAARSYLQAETGNFYQPEAVEAFLEAGPRMLDWFERETAVKFVPTLYPDYHPTVTGGVDVGRSVLAAPFDSSSLGPNLKRLRPPLSTITFMGMMFNSSNADIKHFFNATKSLVSFGYVAKRLAAHALEVARHGRGVQVTSGNALAARLAQTCFDLGIEIQTDTPALRLLQADGRVTGVETPKGAITASRGVVLACGGYAQDLARRAGVYAHLKAGGTHHSPVPSGNTGDGIRLAEAVGGSFDAEFAEPAAWMPVSLVPGQGVFPHLLDRYKPGMIAVGADGHRFTNESESYHDVGAAMVAQRQAGGDASCWLICDHRTIRKYGLGHAKPAPMPLWLWTRNGYLKKGRTLADLARVCGLPAAGLVATVAAYNRNAVQGRDPAFHRGETSFNRYLADPDHKPNPCVAPLEKGPFYAVKMEMGDLGTFDGLKTTVEGAVTDRAGTPIAGLFAVGNDRASIMGGNYPGAGITLGPAMTFGWITGRHLAGINEMGEQA
ncbi:FAD-dependent oxidoreductase [Gemmobacter serpentinus]|uniref:FAD-dependent oxidoreductase n=1 Tax=Gemmobacter serpentinus TaxID=2652247 RepID=UPI00124E3121|nr:FAD-dependent oxidoreductase [Gemmobacter serpentinus]